MPGGLDHVGHCYSVQGLSVKLARTCLLRALAVLYCLTEGRFHKLWLWRSSVLKAERPGARGVSDTGAERPGATPGRWRDGHSLGAVSTAVAELSGGAPSSIPAASASPRSRPSQHSLWRKAHDRPTLSYDRTLKP